MQATSETLKPSASCCGLECKSTEAGLRKITIVGNPNVGKSVMFNNLTKHYVMVSNYPGTSVEVSSGTITIENNKYELIDTPGIYSLSPLTEEERVARRIMLKEELHLVIHVIDAKNIERMLVLTLQLIEAGLPVILVLNMADEADRLGIGINVAELERVLGVYVVKTTAIPNGRNP